MFIQKYILVLQKTETLKNNRKDENIKEKLRNL